MRTVESILTELENESNAMKATFSRSATSLNVYTYKTHIATVPNLLVEHIGNEINSMYGPERICITFRTKSGANTIAKLEFNSDYIGIGFGVAFRFRTIRRARFSGGARWIITSPPKYTEDSSWSPINYNIAVHSIVEGTLTVENMKS